MNIFKILSSYDGRIQEPNISALLAYLLDTNEDHGLADKLLKSIISDFQNSNLNLNDLNYEIQAEFQVELENAEKKRRDIDILIEFYDKNKNLTHALCIEDKITDSSIQKDNNQLQDELNGLKNYYTQNKQNPEIYFCFLSLEKSKKSEEEFDNLKHDKEKKLHLYWKGNENSIQYKLLDILEKERRGEIEPIADDVIFMLKSFLSFIRTDFKSDFDEKQEKREKTDYGKPLDEYFYDYAQSLDCDKEYTVKYIKKGYYDYVLNKSGKELKNSDLNRKMSKVTVNNKNRIHLHVTSSNCERKNLFYYPDENDKKIVKRYSPDINKDVKVYPGDIDE